MKNIVLVGLVNLDTSHGDAQHFSSLRDYLSKEYNVYSITINGRDITITIQSRFHLVVSTDRSIGILRFAICYCTLSYFTS